MANSLLPKDAPPHAVLPAVPFLSLGIRWRVRYRFAEDRSPISIGLGLDAPKERKHVTQKVNVT